ncbi:MAG: hypothetical protein AB1941_21715 [Gemmatimonadota bacterium]
MRRYGSDFRRGPRGPRRYDGMDHSLAGNAPYVDRAWYGGPWAWAPYVGMGTWTSAPFPPRGYPADGLDRERRVPPEESPAYGRGGDRMVRQWARRYGYDFEYRIPPRGPREGGGRARGRRG